MRPRCVLWVVVATGMCVGCKDGAPQHSTSWLDHFRQGVEASGPDMVVMEVALVERPYGDPYVNWGLWAATDEQVVEVEVKAQLEDNGFRVGQIGGLLPGELQGLLASQKTCPEPRRIQSHVGKPTQLLIGPGLARAEYRLQHTGEEPVVLDDAQCLLEVTAAPAEGGLVRLKFVPVVEHGDARVQAKPTADRSGFMYAQDRPAERYPQLGWEMTVSANEFVVVGGRFDRPGTLGRQLFLRATEQPPVQRLLVVRAGMAGDRRVEEWSPPEHTASGDVRSPPLAQQASHSAFQGAAP